MGCIKRHEVSCNVWRRRIHPFLFQIQRPTLGDKGMLYSAASTDVVTSTSGWPWRFFVLGCEPNTLQ